MSDSSGLKDTVTDAVLDNVDVEDYLGADALERIVGGDLDADTAATIGGHVGSEIGESFGRRFGSEFEDAVADADDEEPLGTRVKEAGGAALSSAASATLSREALRGSLTSGVKALTDDGGSLLGGEDSDEGDDEQDADGESDGDGDEQDADEESDEADDSDDEQEADEDQEAEEEEQGDGSDSDDQNAADAIPDDLGSVREETYRDLLDVMSYDDLQSVAKEVGVKANLGREDMTDEIVSELSDDGEEA